jgi:hypothetical protein
MRPLLFALVLGLVSGIARADSDTAAASPALPKEYKDYMIDPGSLSPDKQYGFIYPAEMPDDENAKIKNFLVALKPFRVVIEIPAGDDAYSRNKGHASFSASWAKNSSAVVVNEGSRWGPGTVFVIPLDHGKPGKIAELTADIIKLAEPDYKKSSAEPYNENYHFMFEAAEDCWPINDHGQVIVDCDCVTNPKGDPDTKSWKGSFHGVWDIAQGKYLTATFKRTFSGEFKE